MDNVAKSKFDLAVVEAERVAQEILDQGNDSSAILLAEQALVEMASAGIRPEDTLPSGHGLALAGPTRGGKSFLQAYLAAVREKLCDKNGELYKLSQTGLTGVGSAVVSAVMLTLGLSLAMVTLAAAIAGILLATSVDAYCKWSSAES